MIGAVFAMISALFCVMVVLVGSAAAGREVRDELDRIRRGERPADDEVQRQWDEVTAQARSRWEMLRVKVLEGAPQSAPGRRLTAQAATAERFTASPAARRVRPSSRREQQPAGAESAARAVVVGPEPLSPAQTQLLLLQRRAGNAAVGRLLRARRTLQRDEFDQGSRAA